MMLRDFLTGLKALGRVVLLFDRVLDDLEALKKGQEVIEEELEEIDRKLLQVCESYRG